MGSKNKPGCCCENQGSGLDCNYCCRDESDGPDNPDSFDVEIPPGEFSNDRCNQCTSLDGTTYNLTPPASGVTAISPCESVSPCGYSYSNRTCNGCGINDFRTIFYLGLKLVHDPETDLCRVHLQIVFNMVDPSNCNTFTEISYLCAVYQSDWFSMGQCNTDIECEHVSTSYQDGPLGLNPACTVNASPSNPIIVTPIYA